MCTQGCAQGDEAVELIRIGEKLVSPAKINDVIKKILDMRKSGMSQQEVAEKLNLDRTFISRLESIGSIRRGGQTGIVCFPVSNTAELKALAARYGLEPCLILSNEERWGLVKQSSALDFFNLVTSYIQKLRQCDTVLVFCSDKWSRLAEVFLDNQVIAVEIGTTPMSDDIHLDVERVESILRQL